MKPGLEVINLFSCLSQTDHEKFILLINVKMSKIVGILTFISRINITFVCFKQENTPFTFNEQVKFHAHLG